MVKIWYIQHNEINVLVIIHVAKDIVQRRGRRNRSHRWRGVRHGQLDSRLGPTTTFIISGSQRLDYVQITCTQKIKIKKKVHIKRWKCY